MESVKRQLLILDGGLATELEAMGHDLRHPLWSAKLLVENPEAIEAVHRSYLMAGAQIITSASYQATIPALMVLGFSREQAAAVLAFSVELARNACQKFQQDHGGEMAKVAASLGPYGAFLADGSEFRGDYGITKEELYAHHLTQFEVMAKAGADYLVYETVPSAPEAEVLAELYDEHPQSKGWISFSCKDGTHLNDGTPIAQMVPLVERTVGLIGMGINCTAPQHVAALLREARKAGLTKMAIVYPNSGEVFEPFTMSWKGNSSLEAFADQALEWRNLGAGIVGGCCRTKPEHIRMLKRVLGF